MLHMQHASAMSSRQGTIAEDQLMEEMACGCTLTRTRLIARVITGIYDEALRPFGVGSPQFSLLVVISKLAPVSRAEIGRYNQLDRSTLTRNLQLLLAGGWIHEVESTTGGRGRPIALTESGRRLLVDAAAAWKVAQARAEQVLGAQGTKAVMRIGDGLLNLPTPR